MDGKKQSLSANFITENVFAQVDQDGNRQVLLNEIINYRTTGKEVKQQDAFITTRTGTKRRCETTIGWELLVQSLKDDTIPTKMDENWLRYEFLNLRTNFRTKLAEDVVLCVHNTTSALNR